MRNLFYAALLFAAGVNTSFTSPGKVINLTVQYSFKNIVDGFDHDCRTQIYIDDELAGTSTVKKESQSNSVTVPMKKGSHHVRVVNQALYEEDWEDHTVANSYSIDCLYEATIDLKKSASITLLFDVDNGTTRIEE